MGSLSADGRPWVPVLGGVVVGTAGSFLGTALIPETVFQFRAALVGALCVGSTVALLSDGDLRSTVLLVAVTEILRSVAVYLVVGGWILLYSGEGPGFLPFYLLFVGVFTVVVAVGSTIVAGSVGAVTWYVQRVLRDRS